MAYGSRLQRSEDQEPKAGETNGKESVDKRMHHKAMQQAAEKSGKERTLDEPTIDELLDDGNWNQEPVAASADTIISKIPKVAAAIIRRKMPIASGAFFLLKIVL